MKDIKQPTDFETLIKRLKTEWPAQYGDVHIGSGYGFRDITEIESGAEPRWIIYAYSDDKTIRDKLPKQVDGFDVKISGIPRAQ